MRALSPLLSVSLVFLGSAGLITCRHVAPSGPPWAVENPVAALPTTPLGISASLDTLPVPPTPERVRLGRWLFYDARLSADGTVSCGTCHRPDQGFSQTEKVSTGVFGRRGTRKSPSFVNQAWAPSQHFFWDGRAASLEEQALAPIENPVEMGLSRSGVVTVLEGIPGYRPYFAEAFGDDRITAERVAHALADYERTRFAGNSAWDRWRATPGRAPVDEAVRLGHTLFFGKAACSQCHLGENFTDGRFHNLGIGWDAAAARMTDEGRFTVSGQEADRGAFKTPTLRDVNRHGPFMHDGSIRTLREVVEFYNRGGNPNPWLSAKVFPLGLTDTEIDALVAFMTSLDSDLPPEVPPTLFPR